MGRKTNIVLYQAEWCPYCVRVRKKLTDLLLDYQIVNEPHSHAERLETKAASGQTSIPVLVDGKILEEVDVGAARSANADLMQAAGILKSGKDVEVNVGISVGPPTLNIQVMPAPPSKVVARESVVIDAQFTQVPDDESWLG